MVTIHRCVANGTGTLKQHTIIQIVINLDGQTDGIVDITGVTENAGIGVKPVANSQRFHQFQLPDYPVAQIGNTGTHTIVVFDISQIATGIQIAARRIVNKAVIISNFACGCVDIGQAGNCQPLFFVIRTITRTGPHSGVGLLCSCCRIRAMQVSGPQIIAGIVLNVIITVGGFCKGKPLIADAIVCVGHQLLACPPGFQRRTGICHRLNGKLAAAQIHLNRLEYEDARIIVSGNKLQIITAGVGVSSTACLQFGIVGVSDPVSVLTADHIDFKLIFIRSGQRTGPFMKHRGAGLIEVTVAAHRTDAVIRLQAVIGHVLVEHALDNKHLVRIVHRIHRVQLYLRALAVVTVIGVSNPFRCIQRPAQVCIALHLDHIHAVGQPSRFAAGRTCHRTDIENTAGIRIHFRQNAADGRQDHGQCQHQNQYPFPN